MPRRKSKITRDKHVLYEAAVQSPDTDVDFLERVYRRKRGKRFERLREDFCGTAVLACEWVRRRPENRAWGVDLDPPTLEWGRKHRVAHLGDAADRLNLVHADVRAATTPQVDVVAALNFSYSVFKSREELGGYFGRVRKALRSGGAFFVDALGGQETMGEVKERRRIPAQKVWDGEKVRPFTYVWEQARFNPIDHHIYCHIHFRLVDGTKMTRAFTYDWRLWTLPELQELMREAGFAETEVYMDGWDDEADEADGVYRLRKRFENTPSWVAYVVGMA